MNFQLLLDKRLSDFSEQTFRALQPVVELLNVSKSLLSASKNPISYRKTFHSLSARTGIVNRGDSFRRRRSRSSSLIPPASPIRAPDDGLSSHSGPSDSYLVAMLGAPGVGKCALLSQFRTSECINAYETGRGKLRKLSKVV